MPALKVGLALLIFTAVGLAGCATTEAGQSQVNWVGKNIAQVIEQWGQPQDKSTLSDGSSLWVFKTDNTATFGGKPPVRMVRKQRTETYVDRGATFSRQVDYDEPEYDRGAVLNADCEAHFIVKDDVVSSVTFKGDGCTSEAS